MPGSCPHSCAALNVMHSLSLTPHPHLPHRLTSHPHLPHRFTSHPHLPQSYLPWVLRPDSTVLEENIQEVDVGGVDLDVVLGSMGKCQWRNGNRGILRGLGLHSTLTFPRLSAAGVDAPLPADTAGLTAVDRLSWSQDFKILNPPPGCRSAQQATTHTLGWQMSMS